MMLLLPLIAVVSVVHVSSVLEDVLQEFNALMKEVESDDGFTFCVNGAVILTLMAGLKVCD